MTSTNPNDLPKIASPTTITLGIGASIFKFGGTEIQFLTVLNNVFLRPDA